MPGGVGGKRRVGWMRSDHGRRGVVDGDGCRRGRVIPVTHRVGKAVEPREGGVRNVAHAIRDRHRDSAVRSRADVCDRKPKPGRIAVVGARIHARDAKLVAVVIGDRHSAQRREHHRPAAGVSLRIARRRRHGVGRVQREPRDWLGNRRGTNQRAHIHRAGRRAVDEEIHGRGQAAGIHRRVKRGRGHRDVVGRIRRQRRASLK